MRTRFAPSPTGYLHIGGARTALFAWLFARHHGGDFILRIEDTDRERSTEESIQAILDAMAWLNLDYDEGPIYQTKRFDRYSDVVQQLLAEGKAYRCYCSKERLTELREQQLENKQKPRYDGCCRDKGESDESQPHVIRFRNPQEGEVVFDDLVRGRICVQNTELDDLIIARTDGTPTYNFTVVVDDWDMKISHVVRGDDHINNTPRQINILNALGADIPHYAHVPMILGGDGKRLSKRHGAVSVMQYKEQGYLPEALLNCLVRLGWSHGDQEVFSVIEMMKLFNLDAINNSPARFDEEKLAWLNQHYMKHADPSSLVLPLSKEFESLGVDYRDGPTLEEIIVIQAERTKTLREMAGMSRYFFEDFEAYDEKAARKNLKPEILDALKEVASRIRSLEGWEKQALHQVIIDVAEQFELKLGKLAQPIRVAMTSSTVSPPIDITLQLIGRERVLARLERAVGFIEALA
ncbi:MAG: glutamate--tRNA ligase [Gammaproteobacteria bacterium]|nr:glutamate--tRNA ligase [Gammaproteobacteria bacterium]